MGYCEHYDSLAPHNLKPSNLITLRSYEQTRNSNLKHKHGRIETKILPGFRSR